MRSAIKNRAVYTAAVVAVAAIATTGGALPTSGVTTANTDVTHRQGVLPDGQEWQISLPDNWNGIVINDLDAVGNVESMTPTVQYFLDNGFAYTGTRRHPDRSYNWDPRAESNNMVRVIDIFESEFGEPTKTIQFGCSGGGSVALSVAEDHPESFDGAIAMHASDPLTLANVRLDLSFALEALLDTEDVLPLIIEHGQQSQAAAAWQAALESAAATSEGRARMALAAVLAQYPIWGSGEKPDMADEQALQDAVVDAVMIGVIRAVTGRPMWDQPAGLVSWNAGIDYTKFYNHSNPAHRQIVKAMYAEAGLASQDVKRDLTRINAQPRITATESGVRYFASRMRDGDAKIPVLHVSAIGDASTPPSVMARYEKAIRHQGATALYRQAFVDAPGHCSENVAEVAAFVQVMLDRIDNGTWKNSTKPSVLNQIGAESGEGEPRFIKPGRNAGWTLPTTLDRAFLPGSTFVAADSAQ